MPVLPSRGGVPLKWRAHRLCSPNSAGLFVAGDASHSWQAQMHVNATGLAYVLDSRQPYLRAKRRMISPNIGSFTFSAACEAESHFTTRSCFSGHCLFWRRT
jgi:hypothetical protein